MKKQQRKGKLAIHRETLLTLSDFGASQAAGGTHTLQSNFCNTTPSETACGTSSVCYSVHCTANTVGCTPNSN